MTQTASANLDIPSAQSSDIANTLDTLAVNITYSIDPAVTAINAKIQSLGPMGPIEPAIYTAKAALVEASTFNFSVFSNYVIKSSQYPVFLNANPVFLQNYYNLQRLTGISSYSQLNTVLNNYQVAKAQNNINLNNIFGIAPATHTLQTDSISSTLNFNSVNSVAIINSLQALATTTNSSTATGGNVLDIKSSYALSDLNGRYVNANLNLSDSNVTTFSNTLDPIYAQYTPDFAGNTSQSQFVAKASDVDKTQNHQTIITGFYNTEQQALIQYLQVNFAAQKSTATDTINPSRVHILDYQVQNSNLTTYVSNNFRTRLTNSIQNAVSSSAVATYINFFGIKINLANFGIFVQPTSASTARLFDSLTSSVSGVFNAASAVVSAPLPTISGVINTVATLPQLVSGGINTAVSTGGQIVRAALSTPSVIQNSIVNPAVSGAQYVASTATNLVKGGANIITKGATGVVSGAEGVLSTGGHLVTGGFDTLLSLPGTIIGTLAHYAIYIVLGIIVLIIGAVLFMQYRKKKNDSPYDYDYGRYSDYNRRRPY